jgi:Na+/H+ antiporter NhaA
VAIGLAPEHYLVLKLWWLAPAIVAYAVAAGLAISLVTLALSSLTKSARVAGISFAAVFVGLEMVRLLLQFGLNHKEAVVLSVWADLKALGVALFAVQDPQLEIAWGWPLAVLAALSLACLALISSRVRAVEIVA